MPFLLVPCIYLITLFLNAKFGQTPIDFSTVFAHRIFGPSANLALFIVPFFVVDAISNGEEIGWRGYVLPRLQAKHNALVSSLIVGVIWGLWHIPKYVSHWDTVAFAWFNCSHDGICCSIDMALQQHRRKLALGNPVPC